MRRPMVTFPTEGNILARHPVKSPRYIPGFIRIAGILREIRRTRSCRRTVDRRQQNQIPPGIVDLSASQCHGVLISIEPEAVFDGFTPKNLLWAFFGICPAARAPPPLASPHYPGAGRGLLPKPLCVVRG